MQEDVVTVGVDLAKNVFQVHAIAADGKVLVRRQPRRAEVLKFFSFLPRGLVGMEACASAHHWDRELLALGHDVRLMPPAYVKPYVKRGKTDAADAEAICDAVTRPTMRFVAVKSVDQQAVLMAAPKTLQVIVCLLLWTAARTPVQAECRHGATGHCDRARGLRRQANGQIRRRKNHVTAGASGACAGAYRRSGATRHIVLDTSSATSSALCTGS